MREPLGDARTRSTPAAGAAAPPGGARRSRSAHSSLSVTWPCARWWTRLASSRSSTGWPSSGSRIARERRPRRARRSEPQHAEAEERRHDREADVAARGREVLDRGQHAVARRRPRCAAERGYGSPPGRSPGSPGNEAAGVARDRMAVLGGDRVRVEVVVAAAVRPADVVEQQQRQLGARRALAEDPQLLADGVEVVVAVDHDGVGQRDPRQRRRGSSRGSARARDASRASATRPSCGAGSIGADASRRRRPPSRRARASGRPRTRRPRPPSARPRRRGTAA